MSSERETAARPRGANRLRRAPRARAPWLALLAALVLGPVSVLDAQPPEALPAATRIENARLRFEEGLALARAGECERAISEFEASIALAPRPNAYFNAARCEERLGRFSRALADYRAFVVMADAEDVSRLRVTTRIDALLAQIVVVRVEANVEARVFVGDVHVAETPAALELDPGPVVIEVRAEGYETARHTLVVHSGERSALLVTLGRLPMADASMADASRLADDSDAGRAAASERGEPRALAESPEADARRPEPDDTTSTETATGRPEADDRPAPEHRRLRRGPFVAGVVMTGGALAIGAGFGIDALVLRRRGDRLDPYDADGREAARADVRRASQVADAAFFSGVGFAVATTVLGVFTDFDGNDEAPALGVRPIITTASVGLVVDGRFR